MVCWGEGQGQERALAEGGHLEMGVELRPSEPPGGAGHLHRHL